MVHTLSLHLQVLDVVPLGNIANIPTAGNLVTLSLQHGSIHNGHGSNNSVSQQIQCLWVRQNINVILDIAPQVEIYWSKIR